MRPKPTDLHGHHLAPACGHCGLPLAQGVKVCPFCDRRVSRGASGPGGRVILGVQERTLLFLAAAILAVAAVVTALAAIAS